MSIIVLPVIPTATQKSPNSIGFSPLVPSHPSDLNLNMGSEPPSRVPGTSPYSGLDRQVSGLTPVTQGAFTPNPLVNCGIFAFDAATCFNLATEVNSLPRVSKRTM